ncbi:hypothetical protein [Oceanidesulfovibrio marinus]|uniref:Uncharacterized protein n=1 Tax=Oceanidesulfovibrio marinus TaxID=370038 RepID=A0A6P1ZDL7_9BACT|nr:hypothetical protein [Oceanidesulfovibrio marinus]TVM31873.1 hypothetical protein DQK91_16840 [Oceanidesulfovibrio marinus]
MEVYDFKTRLCYLPFAAAAALVAFVLFVIPTPPLSEIRLTDWISFLVFVGVVFTAGYVSYRFIVSGIVIKNDRVAMDYMTRTKLLDVRHLEEVHGLNALCMGLLKIHYGGETVYAAVMIPFWREGASDSFERLVDALGYRTAPFQNGAMLAKDNAPQGVRPAAEDGGEFPDLFDPLPDEPHEK